MNPNPVFKQSQESHHNCHPPLSTNTIPTTKEKKTLQTPNFQTQKTQNPSHHHQDPVTQPLPATKPKLAPKSTKQYSWTWKSKVLGCPNQHGLTHELTHWAILQCSYSAWHVCCFSLFSYRANSFSSGLYLLFPDWKNS